MKRVSRIVFKYRFIALSTLLFAVVLVISARIFSVEDATNKKLVDFVRSYGWQVEDTPREISYLTVPETFDAVYRVYESMQQGSGLEFGKFKGKRVIRYTYKVLNHEKSQNSLVLAGIFVCEDKVIGADVFSPDINGFMHPITEISQMTK